MTRRKDDSPYPDYHPYRADAAPGPWQKRVCAILITLALAIVALYATGCASPKEVVTTEISYDRANGTLRIVSPKDVTIGKLATTRLPDGSLSVDLDDYAATANAGAIAAQAQAAQQQTALLGLIGQLIAASLPGAQGLGTRGAVVKSEAGSRQSLSPGPEGGAVSAPAIVHPVVVVGSGAAP